MRLKKHESPRRRGRNDKSQLAAARLRQLKKRTQQLRNQLKSDLSPKTEPPPSST